MGGMLNSPAQGWKNLNSGDPDKFASHGLVNWGFFTDKPKLPKAPPKAPMLDDAIAKRNAQDSASRRGRATTILTSGNGLPNLGATAAPSAGGR